MRLRLAAASVRLGGRTVLDGISMAAEPCRITGVVGANGAGKSTALRALAGLVPLAQGRVLLGERDLGRIPAAERGRLVAYLPQSRLVHWPLSVRHVVGLGRLPHGGLSRGPRRGTPGETAVSAAMAAMDVADLAERPVSELSGGELARVLLARALAQEAPVLIADEPTAGLDPAHAVALFETLAGLARNGHVIVVALHDLSLAARFCHEIVLMSAGRVAATGAPEAVLTGERLTPVLGVRMAFGRIEGVPAVVPVGPMGRGAPGCD